MTPEQIDSALREARQVWSADHEPENPYEAQRYIGARQAIDYIEEVLKQTAHPFVNHSTHWVEVITLGQRPGKNDVVLNLDCEDCREALKRDGRRILNDPSPLQVVRTAPDPHGWDPQPPPDTSWVKLESVKDAGKDDEPYTGWRIDTRVLASMGLLCSLAALVLVIVQGATR